jgi:hypothetical protein
MSGRLYLSAAEIADLAPVGLPRAAWPAVSLGLLTVFAVLLPAGLTTLLNALLLFLAAAVWLAGRQPLPAALTRVLAGFAAVIVVGLLSGADAPRYLYFKDLWYCSNPVLVVLVGFVLGRLTADTARGLRAFLAGGTAVAALHLFIVWRRLALGDLLDLPAAQLRGATGIGFEGVVLVLLIAFGAWGQWRRWLRLPPAAVAAGAALCAASVLLSFSRTLALELLVGGLVLAGFFARHATRRTVLLALAVLAALAMLQVTVDTRSFEARQSFLGKLARSIEEQSPDDRQSVSEANANWRGYETARAFATWSGGNPVQWLMGQGFGAQVDLGYFQNLTRNPREASRFIPVLHNGYAYLLVKTGLAGVLLYLAVLLHLWRTGHAAAAAEPAPSLRRLEGRLLQSCALVLAVTTWFVAGAFSKFEMFAFMLLIGFLLAALAGPGRPSDVDADAS